MSYHKAVIAVALTAFLATFFWMFRKCGTDPLGTSFGTSFGMSKQKIVLPTDGGSQMTKWEGVHTC